MAVRNGAKTQCWLYDIIFSVHSFLAFINVLWVAVYVLEVLLPVIRGDLLGGVIMLVAIAVEFPARCASAVIIFASFYFYRDWSILLLAVLLGLYYLTLKSPASFFVATIYTVAALLLSYDWFFRRRQAC